MFNFIFTSRIPITMMRPKNVHPNIMVWSVLFSIDLVRFDHASCTPSEAVNATMVICRFLVFSPVLRNFLIGVFSS